MKFNIPKRLTVGGVDYVVNIKDVLNYSEDFGFWQPQGTIDIARGVEGNRLPESRMRTTFWHELTHAILDRMGRTDLNDSEEFVNTFSAFLSGAIDTMEDRMVDSFNNEYLRAGIVTFKFADVDFPQEFGDMNKKWKDDEDEGNTYAHKLQEVKAIKVERYNVEKLINFVGGGQMTIPRRPNGIAVFSFLNNGGAYLDAPEHDYVVRVGESRFKVVPAKEFENEWELK